jgi:hypothetical protein
MLNKKNFKIMALTGVASAFLFSCGEDKDNDNAKSAAKEQSCSKKDKSKCGSSSCKAKSDKSKCGGSGSCGSKDSSDASTKNYKKNRESVL